MTQGLGSERSPVACIPRVAVESGGRGVAGQTHVRRWPRTTRCNELAVIVIRDSELVGRESLIAPFRALYVACGMGNRPGRYAIGSVSSVSSK
jgi:hypothetical protein